MERRQFPRKEASLKVVCQPEESPGTKIIARTVDISQGGVSLKLNRPFNASGKVSVTVYGPLWQGHIKGSGAVAWQSTLSSGESRMGIEFTSMGWTEWEIFLRRV